MAQPPKLLNPVKFNQKSAILRTKSRTDIDRLCNDVAGDKFH